MAWLDAFLDAYMAEYRAAHSEIYQSQSNAAIFFGSQIGNVGVMNAQDAEIHQSNSFGSRGVGGQEVENSHGFGGEDVEASNASVTTQRQGNLAAIAGDRIGNVDVTNVQSAETQQSNDFGSDTFGGADVEASNASVTTQRQGNLTAIAGDQIGDVGVTNVQSAETNQNNSFGSHGFGGYEAGNASLTAQGQTNFTALSGDQLGAVNVTNIQIAEIHQDIDLSDFDGLGGPGADIFIANLTLQTQGNFTGILGQQTGDVDVTNLQNAGTVQHLDLAGLGFGSPDGDIFIANLTLQDQANPTIVSGSQFGDVDVTNLQVADVHQNFDLG